MKTQLLHAWCWETCVCLRWAGADQVAASRSPCTANGPVVRVAGRVGWSQRRSWC